MKQNKQMLNEVRRMQQLAGIKPIVEMEDMEEAGGFDMDQAVEEGMDHESEGKISVAVDNAIKAGQEVTIQGAAVAMSGGAAAKMEDGSFVYWNTITPEDVLIDGQPVDLSAGGAPGVGDNPAQSFADRYGPNGGYDTRYGRRTFD